MTELATWARRVRLRLVAACQCDRGRFCPLFKRPRCRKHWHWCHGAGDSDVCDDCWVVVTKNGAREVPWAWQPDYSREDVAHV